MSAAPSKDKRLVARLFGFTRESGHTICNGTWLSIGWVQQRVVVHFNGVIALTCCLLKSRDINQVRL